MTSNRKSNMRIFSSLPSLLLLSSSTFAETKFSESNLDQAGKCGSLPSFLESNSGDYTLSNNYTYKIKYKVNNKTGRSTAQIACKKPSKKADQVELDAYKKYVEEISWKERTGKFMCVGKKWKNLVKFRVPICPVVGLLAEGDGGQSGNTGWSCIVLAYYRIVAV